MLFNCFNKISYLTLYGLIIDIAYNLAKITSKKTDRPSAQRPHQIICTYLEMFYKETSQLVHLWAHHPSLLLGLAKLYEQANP